MRRIKAMLKWTWELIKKFFNGKPYDWLGDD